MEPNSNIATHIPCVASEGASQGHEHATAALCALYERQYGCRPTIVSPITGSGSNRKYYRLAHADGQSVIGVYGTSVAENRAFIALARHFAHYGVRVPLVIVADATDTCYLQQDLGNTTLFQLLQAEGVTDHTHQLLMRTMQALPRMQFDGARTLDFSVCYPQPCFNHRSVMWDLNYFKYCFLKTCRLDFQEDLLEDDFEAMAERLTKGMGDIRTFMYRDFQSRNVMIAHDEPYFIDFQGGRRGPVLYDVASFVWQARARYAPMLREELVDTYLKAAQPYLQADTAVLREQLDHFVLFRMLQVLGAYGYRGKYEGKGHFVQSIPLALENMHQLLVTCRFAEYPYLTQLLQQVAEPKETVAEPQVLTVHIMSFGYKFGIPRDDSGHGGGFVFDCRALHNPGRYAAYKTLTGKDAEVMAFLESQSRVREYLQQVFQLVDMSVDNYLQRGFTHLSVAFGCTGGQHRSVYCAEQTAAYLRARYPQIHVELKHREQEK